MFLLLCLQYCLDVRVNSLILAASRWRGEEQANTDAGLRRQDDSASVGSGLIASFVSIFFFLIISRVVSCMYLFKKDLELFVRTAFTLSWLGLTAQRYFISLFCHSRWLISSYYKQIIFPNNDFMTQYIFSKLSFALEITQVSVFKPVNELQVQMGLIGHLWWCKFQPFETSKGCGFKLWSAKQQIVRHLLSTTELCLNLLNRWEVMNTAGN